METLSPASLPPGAPADTRPATCPNCGTARQGEYCPACGQHLLDGRITLRALWRDFGARFLNLERGLLHTFVQMFTDPGGVARRYVEGQRRRYVNPLGYLVLAATVAFLSMLHYDQVMYQYMHDTFEEAWSGDPTLMATLEEMAGPNPVETIASGMVSLIKSMYTYLSLLICIPFALALRVFLGGPPRHLNLAEMFVFALYTVAQATLLVAVLSPLVHLIGYTAYTVLVMLIMVGVVGYAAAGFFGRRTGPIVLAMVSYVAGYLAFIVLSMIVGMAFGVYVGLKANL